MASHAEGLPDAADVAIVGGGVIGLAAAHELAVDHDVVVLERGQLAAEASALAAGEVTMTPTYTDYPSVAEFATGFFRDLDGTGDFAFEERESVEVVPAEAEGIARRRAARLAGEGYDMEFLEAAALEARYPRFDLDDGFVGGVRQTGTGFVDPYTFAMTLAAEAESRGATLHTNVAVESVRVDGGSVVGVETDAGRIDAPAVVVAAGWRTREFLAGVTEVPVRPYRTQIVVLDPGEALDDGFPMGWIPGQHAYFRPELNGDLLVGGWSFATDDPIGASGNADEAFTQHVAELVPRFLRDVDGAGFVNGWAGIDGATPDTRPIVDAPADAPDGLVVATGFNGRGIMTAPVAGRLVRALVAGESAPFPAEPFAIDRFDDRSADFPFISISAGDYEEE